MTLVRFGLYAVDGNDTLTLVGSTANDTTIFTVASQDYGRPLTTPYPIVAGQRYATGIVVASATTVPSLLAQQLSSQVSARLTYAFPPRVAANGSTTSYTDLPNTLPTAAMSGSVWDIFYSYVVIT